MLTFGNWYFLLLIPVVLYLLLKKNKRSSLKFSSVKHLNVEANNKAFIYKLGKWLIALSLVLMVIGLARPMIPTSDETITDRGIDIVLVLDVSGSMESVDFKPNRLEVARKTISDFVEKRFEDRLALIVFGGSAYTKIPLTLDHNVLDQSLKRVSVKSVNEEGTAIGMAISVGVNRLKKSDSVTKVMILVTDGDNNAGTINPQTASELAKGLGIKIYTIGVGSNETIMPVTMYGMRTYQTYQGGLNEELLKNIAKTTNGQYYRAKDENALEDIFKEINELEKTSFEEKNYKQYNELAFIFIGISLIVLLIGVFLDKYYFIQIP